MRPGGTPPASKTCPRPWWPRSSPAPGPHTRIRWRTWPDRQRGRPRAPGVGLARRRDRPPSPRPPGPASPPEPGPPPPRPDPRAGKGGAGGGDGVFPACAMFFQPFMEPPGESLVRTGVSMARRLWLAATAAAGTLARNARIRPVGQRIDTAFGRRILRATGRGGTHPCALPWWRPGTERCDGRAGSAVLGQRGVVVGAYTVRASAAAGGDRRPALPLARPPCPAHWNTFAFGCGMSAFGRPGGAHALLMP